MKKQIMLIFFLILVLTAPAYAQTGYQAACEGKTILTVSYDEAAFRLDKDSYLGTNRNGHWWLGTFYNGIYAVDLCADRYDGLSESSSLNDLASYLCTLYSREGCTVLETSGGSIPFVILSMNGQNGQSYYAAALIHGYSVSFEIYSMLGGTDNTGLEILKTLLYGVYR